MRNLIVKRASWSLFILTVTASLILASSVVAGTVYFDSKGNQISEEQYNKLAAARDQERADMAANVKGYTGKVHTVIVKAPNSQNSSSSFREVSQSSVSSKKGVPRDVLGRPLKDSEGRWITYPDDRQYGGSYGNLEYSG